MAKHFDGWVAIPLNVQLRVGDVWVWKGDPSYRANDPDIRAPHKNNPVSQVGNCQKDMGNTEDWQAYRPLESLAAATTMSKPTSYLDWAEGSTPSPPTKTDEPKSKPTKFKKDQFPDIATRASVFGRVFPESKEGNWIGCDGAGWVHESELRLFKGEYMQCCVSKTWHRHSFMQSTEFGGFVNKREIKNGDWEVCQSSGYAFLKEDMTDAVNESGKKIRVSKSCRDKRFFVDDYDKNWYHQNQRCVVKQSEKYKWISSFNYEQSRLFCGCENCNSIFEASANLVLFRGDINQKVCASCYESIVAKDVIKAHNHTIYPKAIFTAPYLPRITEEAKVKWAQSLKALGHPLDGESWKSVQMKKVFLYGVECETEFVNPDKPGKRARMALAAWKALGQDFCIIKHDGSLHGHRDPESGEKIRRGGDYGFEIVSAPCDLATHRERWKRLEKMDGYKELRAWDVGTCGMHVHVSRAPMTALQICRIGYLMNHPKLKEFIQLVAGRASARYNKFIPKKSVSEGNRPDMDKDKYTALNVKHAHTVEFRIFRGTVNPTHIIRNLEFVQAIVEFCHPGDRSIKELGDELAIVKFINSNEKGWPELNRWLRVVAKDREIYAKVLKSIKGAWGPKDIRTIKGEKQEAVDEAHNPDEPVKPKKTEKQTHLAGIPVIEDNF